MRKTSFWIGLFIVLLSCNHKATYDDLEIFINQYREYKNAKRNFPSNDQFFELKNLDLDKLTDSIKSAHALIFKDSLILDVLNEDISIWLKDSIFIDNSKPNEGTVKIDTVNMQELDDSFDYYMSLDISEKINIQGKVFQRINFLHTVVIGEKKLFYELIPTNGRLINTLGEFRILTTGKYHRGLSMYEDESNKLYMDDGRYFCNEHLIDWFILISSDDFFNDNLAIKITDTTYYYDRYWKGELIDHSEG